MAHKSVCNFDLDPPPVRIGRGKARSQVQVDGLQTYLLAGWQVVDEPIVCSCIECWKRSKGIQRQSCPPTLSSRALRKIEYLRKMIQF